MHVKVHMTGVLRLSITKHSF